MPPNEDFADKTEPATPRKRQEARERGQVAKSTDLNTAVLLLAAFLMLLVWGEAMGRGVADLVRASLAHAGSLDLTRVTAVELLGEVVKDALGVVAPFALVLALVAFLANFVQVGPVWSGQVITPDPDRINPVRGFGKIFSMRGLMRTVMGLGKLAVIGAVVYTVLVRYVRPGPGKSLFALFDGDVHTSFLRVKSAACELGIACASAMLLLAVLDVAYQRWQHERDLRMTKRELREELKRFEGDPKIKERRRRMQRQIALQRYMTEVPQADVVVTNPTEFAVALAYAPERDTAPRVVAKGEGLLAQRIREIAVSAGVPVLQRPPLAQALYRQVEVGGEIPQGLYEAVAEVLAYVWRITGKRHEQVA
jgi:flagellar biosynthetic protein FlhB